MSRREGRNEMDDIRTEPTMYMKRRQLSGNTDILPELQATETKPVSVKLGDGNTKEKRF
jgi:hypothetical protein